MDLVFGGRRTSLFVSDCNLNILVNENVAGLMSASLVPLTLDHFVSFDTSNFLFGYFFFK